MTYIDTVFIHIEVKILKIIENRKWASLKLNWGAQISGEERKEAESITGQGWYWTQVQLLAAWKANTQDIDIDGKG